MTTWFTSPETTPTKTAPCEPFVRFASSFPKGSAFLELGSGSGNNLRWLDEKGYVAMGVDSASHAFANWHEPIETFFKGNEDWNGTGWDCIFDIETLCHIENPPYEAIYKALNPGGKFFSIHPADDTKVNISGKGYTRLADILTMRRLLGRGFMRFTVHKTTNWSGDTKITAWQIEAEK